MTKAEFIARHGEESYKRDLEQRREMRSKAVYIARHGEAAWQRHLAQVQAYNKANKEQEKARVNKWQEEHPEAVNACRKKWQEEHPEEVKAHNHEFSRKGGKRYVKNLKYKRTGLQGARNKIRRKHARDYKQYKAIIAPESQIHHEWIPNTSEYRGIALVEADQHMHGIVDVIEILDGKITLRTEEQIRIGGD